MPNNIAVIGDRDFISGFSALGCTLYPADEKTDLKHVFTEVVEADFLCIFILEKYALKIMDLLEQYREEPRPLIIPLADFRKDLSLGDGLLSHLTVKAVGRDITQGI